VELPWRHQSVTRHRALAAAVECATPVIGEDFADIGVLRVGDT
jgi:hypothetical protein